MNFALITEGISEYRIMKHIISKYFKDYEPEINQIQPKVVNNKQETIGGWNEVLKYCEREELNDLFIENEYLIIQIDSDKSIIKPFDVTHTKIVPESGLNVNKTFDELYADIVAKLQSLINPHILQKYNDKILFAICIHSIECWLLPIYYTNVHKTNTQNCTTPLNSELRRRGIHIISKGDKNGSASIKTYDTILKNWKRKQDILDSAQHNTGFNNFISSLSSINI